MWILLSDYNAYDQYGSYFISAFLEKPGVKDIKTLLPQADDALVDHILKGGGRIKFEDLWYTLAEINPGEVY